MYWKISIKITPILPVTIEDPYMLSDHMTANVALCAVTMGISNQLLGNTGVSMINMRIKEAVNRILLKIYQRFHKALVE